MAENWYVNKIPPKYLTLEPPGQERRNRGRRNVTIDQPAGEPAAAAARSIQPSTSAQAANEQDHGDDGDDDDIHVDDEEEQAWLGKYF
jgi:hypothetical protein